MALSSFGGCKRKLSLVNDSNESFNETSTCDSAADENLPDERDTNYCPTILAGKVKSQHFTLKS